MIRNAAVIGIFSAPISLRLTVDYITSTTIKMVQFRNLLANFRLLAFVAAVTSNIVETSSDLVVTKEATFGVSIEGKDVGQMVIGLFGQATPKTVENFAQLATGVNGYGYKGSSFHRTIQGFMIQGGDYVHGDGRGEGSIYGGLFDDEKSGLAIKHHGSGWVSMANRGADTNSCQFFITMKATPWLDGDHVVFGKVVRGMNVARLVSQVPTDDKDHPKVNVTITDSACANVEPYSVTLTPADLVEET